MKFDLCNSIDVRPAFNPAAAVAADTPQVSTILDTQGGQSATLIINNGNNADADATFALTITESNASNMAGATAVAAADLIGTLAGGSFTFADDNEVRKIGYKGSKRYIQATITPTGNTGGTLFLGGAWVLGHLDIAAPAFPS